MADLAHIIFPLKDFNALECDCTCKRISHECRPVHQGKPVIITVKCLKDLVIGDSDCMTDITAGQCFSKNQNVREYQVCYEAVAGTSKSGRHLIKDQKNIIFITQFSGTFQEGDIIHPHSTGALKKRFYNKAVQFVVIKLKGLFKSRDFRWNMDNTFFFVKSKMIIFIVSNFHCLKCISMIGMLKSQYQRSFSSLVGIVLKSHFQGNLYSDTSGIRKETVIQISGEKFLKLCGKSFYRLMSESAKHYMAETIGLLFDCGGEFRMLVTVDHAPPGRNGIDQFLILCIEMHTLGIQDFVRFFHSFHLFIRIPYHLIFTSS